MHGERAQSLVCVFEDVLPVTGVKPAATHSVTGRPGAGGRYLLNPAVREYECLKGHVTT